MTSSNWNIFRVTGPLCGEFIGNRLSVNSPHKDLWRGTLIFSLICTRTNGSVNNRDAGDLKCHRAHYDATVMEILRPLQVKISSKWYFCFTESIMYISVLVLQWKPTLNLIYRQVGQSFPVLHNINGHLSAGAVSYECGWRSVFAPTWVRSFVYRIRLVYSKHAVITSRYNISDSQLPRLLMWFDWDLPIVLY